MPGKLFCPILKPNVQQKERQKSRLSHDALYNRHEVANDLEAFVKVMMYLDLIIVCGHEKC